MDDVVLGDVSEPVFVVLHIGVVVGAVDEDAPLPSWTKAVQRIEQRGLSGSASTDEGDEFPGKDREGDVVDQYFLRSRPHGLAERYGVDPQRFAGRRKQGGIRAHGQKYR